MGSRRGAGVSRLELLPAAHLPPMPDSLAMSGRRLYRKTPSSVTVYGPAPPAGLSAGATMLPRWKEVLLVLLSENPRLSSEDAVVALSLSDMAIGRRHIGQFLRRYRAAAIQFLGRTIFQFLNFVQNYGPLSLFSQLAKSHLQAFEPKSPALHVDFES